MSSGINFPFIRGYVLKDWPACEPAMKPPLRIVINTKKIEIKIITDYFSIECVSGKKVFTSFNGQRVSLALQKNNCIINTSNLKYNINGKINSSVSLISN